MQKTTVYPLFSKSYSSFIFAVLSYAMTRIQVRIKKKNNDTPLSTVIVKADFGIIYTNIECSRFFLTMRKVYK